MSGLWRPLPTTKAVLPGLCPKTAKSGYTPGNGKVAVGM